MADYKSAYTGVQIDDAVSKAHQHSNKTILDNMTAPYTTEEKTKLAGLSNYTLPVASSTTLGGVKAGKNVTVTEDGTLNVTGAVDSVNGKTGTVVLTANDIGAVATEEGKGLSTNDYTTTEKNKLAGIEAGSEVNAVNSVNGKTGVINLSASDVGALPDTITVPTKTSDLQNDSGYLVNAENTNIQINKIWVGTQAQYEAITTKDANTEYNIIEE